MIRSKFSARMVDRAVVVIDKDEGMSVTNDIENVVPYLAKQFDLAEHPLVYRDTDGRWDAVRVRDGQFAAFVLMGARSMTEAIGMAHAARRVGNL